MARSKDRFLTRDSEDVALDGEVWGLEVRDSGGGVKTYGIAGADGQAEAARKEAEGARREAEAGRAAAEAGRVEAERSRGERFEELTSKVSGASMAIGSVAKGDEAAAQITGDPYDWTLDLTLPKGDRGEKGDKGDPGDATNVSAEAPLSNTDGTIRLGTVPIEKGGTGAGDVAQARENLGITPANIGAALAKHGHGAGDVTSGTLSVARGGTGNNAIFGTSGFMKDMFGDHQIDAHFATFSSNWGQGGYLTKAALMQRIYPVGAVYISYNSTSPASLFGGSWTALTGVFPYFNNGTGVGGSNTHTLSVSEMPRHRHTQNIGEWTAVVGAYHDDYALNQKSPGHYANTSYDGDAWVQATKYEGSGSTHNNMPRYQTLYAWRRTA